MPFQFSKYVPLLLAAWSFGALASDADLRSNCRQTLEVFSKVSGLSNIESFDEGEVVHNDVTYIVEVSEPDRARLLLPPVGVEEVYRTESGESLDRTLVFHDGVLETETSLGAGGIIDAHNPSVKEPNWEEMNQSGRDNYPSASPATAVTGDGTWSALPELLTAGPPINQLVQKIVFQSALTGERRSLELSKIEQEVPFEFFPKKRYLGTPPDSLAKSQATHFRFLDDSHVLAIRIQTHGAQHLYLYDVDREQVIQRIDSSPTEESFPRLDAFKQGVFLSGFGTKDGKVTSDSATWVKVDEHGIPESRPVALAEGEKLLDVSTDGSHLLVTDGQTISWLGTDGKRKTKPNMDISRYDFLEHAEISHDGTMVLGVATKANYWIDDEGEKQYFNLARYAMLFDAGTGRPIASKKVQDHFGGAEKLFSTQKMGDSGWLLSTMEQGGSSSTISTPRLENHGMSQSGGSQRPMTEASSMESWMIHPNAVEKIEAGPRIRFADPVRMPILFPKFDGGWVIDPIGSKVFSVREKRFDGDDDDATDPTPSPEVAVPTIY